MLFDIASQLLQYLLQTGSIPLRDLAVRTPDLPKTLRTLMELEQTGEIDIKGDRAALQRIRAGVNEAESRSGGTPEVVLRRLFEMLNEIPQAHEIVLSEKGFRKASR